VRPPSSSSTRSKSRRSRCGCDSTISSRAIGVSCSGLTPSARGQNARSCGAEVQARAGRGVFRVTHSYSDKPGTPPAPLRARPARCHLDAQRSYRSRTSAPPVRLRVC
jgi:hypothetical protein